MLPRTPPLAHSWNDFLRGTNRLFNGRELCDCFRADWVPGSGWKPPEEEKHENRYYRRRLGGAGGDIFGGWVGGRGGRPGRAGGGSLAAMEEHRAGPAGPWLRFVRAATRLLDPPPPRRTCPQSPT